MYKGLYTILDKFCLTGWNQIFLAKENSLVKFKLSQIQKCSHITSSQQAHILKHGLTPITNYTHAIYL